MNKKWIKNRKLSYDNRDTHRTYRSHHQGHYSAPYIPGASLGTTRSLGGRHGSRNVWRESPRSSRSTAADVKLTERPIKPKCDACAASRRPAAAAGSDTVYHARMCCHQNPVLKLRSTSSVSESLHRSRKLDSTFVHTGCGALRHVHHHHHHFIRSAISVLQWNTM